MAGQGGPKTLPAACWQGVVAGRLPWQNTWAAGPATVATGRLVKKQP
jgi:hypothetical protein